MSWKMRKGDPRSALHGWRQGAVVDFCNFWRVIRFNTFGVPIVLTALQWGLGVSGSGQAASGSGPEGRDFNTFRDFINTLQRIPKRLRRNSFSGFEAHSINT